MACRKSGLAQRMDLSAIYSFQMTSTRTLDVAWYSYKEMDSAELGSGLEVSVSMMD